MNKNRRLLVVILQLFPRILQDIDRFERSPVTESLQVMAGGASTTGKNSGSSKAITRGLAP